MRIYADRWMVKNGTDPLHLVGDNAEFEERTQKEFMVENGLKPHHKFLDLACGCLRGTIGLVDYLDDGNFYGADISGTLLEEGMRRTKERGLKNTPNLVQISSFDLSHLPKFDFVLSVSLVTHLFPSDVEELFDGIRNALKDDGTFFFTMYPLGENQPQEFFGSHEIAWFKKSWIMDASAKYGLKVEDVEGDLENMAPSFKIIHRVNSVLGQWVMKAKLMEKI